MSNDQCGLSVGLSVRAVTTHKADTLLRGLIKQWRPVGDVTVDVESLETAVAEVASSVGRRFGLLRQLDCRMWSN